jgi:hypothetical protein
MVTKITIVVTKVDWGLPNQSVVVLEKFVVVQLVKKLPPPLLGGVYTMKVMIGLTGLTLVASYDFHYSEVGLEVNPEKTKYMLVSRCRKTGQRQSIKIANRSFESVEKFKYLGTTLTDQNCVHEEIKSRLNSGNACYHSVQSFVIPPAVQECNG